MNCRLSHPIPSHSWRERAFSLIEILVVVALLSVIILGLILMFDQTQRAFRSGMTQTDVLEGGRAATELIARELSQVTPANRSQGVNFYAFVPTVDPLLQPLPGTPTNSTPVSYLRTNLMEEIFFLTKENQTWTGIGYRVSDPVGGVGTLYRYETNISATYGEPALLYTNWLYNVPLTSMSRVLDGVVHFKVRTYDTNGFWINGYLNSKITAVPPSSIPNSGASPAYYPFDEVGELRFLGDAVPASVEFELGVLEQRVLKRADALPTAAARRAYLRQQAAHVHVFRLRVPVRNVNASAYR